MIRNLEDDGLNDFSIAEKNEVLDEVLKENIDDDTISFYDLGLDEKTLKSVEKKGFKTPTQIQVLAIPRLLNGDSNIIAKARTGTGKTAAFGLPLVQKITDSKPFPQALILTPTRELCLQVCKEIESFTDEKFPRMISCYGGQGMSDQIRALKKGVEIVVGTPGRIQDHIKRGLLDLSNISYFILDEADEMLDMGFIEDIEAIFSKANPNCRILLFSATMPAQILKIASEFMGDYEIVEEENRPEEPLLTEQHYWVVRENEKIEALVRLIDVSQDFYGLIFTQTKSDADTVSRQLEERGYESAALHGDIAQAQREKILWRFRNKKTKILVATDVAARGIDIEGLTHVVNYALPFDAPTYIHRIGRTGRAGKSGFAYTFVRPEERRKLDFIKRAAFKATKGDMIKDEIPDVDEIIKIKRKQLFEQTQFKLAENLNEDDSNSDVFKEMAEILCKEKDPIEVLQNILSISYGNKLDPGRYGKISSINVFNQGSQVRVYVQLGRKDGYNARSIAEYFSKLCHISQRMVDRIDMSEKFSLVSLPQREGLELLEKVKKNKSLPHMHLDTKETEGDYGMRFSKKGSSRGKKTGGQERNFTKEGKVKEGKFYGFEKKYFDDGKKTKRERHDKGYKSSGFSGRREGGKKPIHTNRTGNASLYKKS
ncbi:MAG: DEAD/DEAH box helicase [Treponemataceae bacterium]